MAGPLDKYKFDGIGAASAAAVMAALASSPATIGLTTGCLGKIVNWFFSGLFSKLASLGLVIMNVGAEKIETLIDGNKWDGTWATADAAIKAAQDAHRQLTPAEIKKIDDPVIVAFRKWASFARKTQ